MARHTGKQQITRIRRARKTPTKKRDKSHSWETRLRNELRRASKK